MDFIEVTEIDNNLLSTNKSSLISNNEEKKILCESPGVFTINKFITREECEHMITISKPSMKDSLVSDNKKGTTSKGRTSKNAWIQHNHDKITKQIGEKIAKVVGIPLENAEAFQVIYYDVGNEYRNHYDSWDHNGSEKTLRCVKYGGARLKTALVYLNDVEEGGSTRLNKINVDVKAEQGKMLVFENTLPGTNIKHHLSEHAGMPVIKGEKYAFNLWFKECNSKKLYSEFNPDYYKTTVGISNENINNATVIKPNNIDNNVTTEIINKTISEYKYNNILKIASDMNVESEKYNIYTKKNFIFSSECEKIISTCNFDINNKDKYTNCWIKKELFPELIKKIEEHTNINSRYFENMNIFKYKPNEKHGPFMDGYNLDTDVGKKHTSKLGQRIFTISISLNNTIEYYFSKINKKILYSPKTLLLYDNITHDSIHNINNNMIHLINNNNNTESYILNIYIREKDVKGKLLMNIPEQLYHKINTNTTPIKNIDTQKNPIEDYTKTYEEVLDMFKKNTITQNWHGHKSLKYLFKGDFNYFKDCVSAYINSRVNNENKDINNCSALNMELFNKKHVFDEYHPIIIEKAIKQNTLLVLQEYYKTTIQKGVFLLGDKQSQRFKAHNEPLSRLLHYELLPLIEHIVGKSLEPTYTYLSCYVTDSDLPAHTDRADCEYTVSFVIDKPTDITWPIYFHTVKQKRKHQGRVHFIPDKKECIECDCEAGGFMMFNGTDHAHFREKLHGDYYYIVLLHYKSL
jgi:prolyl 4-hydroxylase